MRTLKKFGVLASVVLALSAIGAVNASAAEFTASAEGELTGKATETQVITTNGGQIKCIIAEPSGQIIDTATDERHVTIHFTGCSAFGFANVNVSSLTLLFTANGQVHISVTITISVPIGFCNVKIPAQTVSSAIFSNIGSKVKSLLRLTGITYTSSGGLCGSSGNNGTYTGGIELERVGGGSMSFHN